MIAIPLCAPCTRVDCNERCLCRCHGSNVPTFSPSLYGREINVAHVESRYAAMES